MIIGIDPGKTNFAWCALCEKTLKIYGIGKVTSPIHDINSEIHKHFYRKQIDLLLYKYNPKYIVAERFQNRGKFTGNQGEVIGLMLGILYEKAIMFNGTKTQIIPAHEWKGHFRHSILTDDIAKFHINKQYEKYARSKSKKKKKKNKKFKYHFEMEHFIESKTLSEHEIDALGIALWKAEQLRKQTGLLWRVDDSLIRGNL